MQAHVRLPVERPHHERAPRHLRLVGVHARREQAAGHDVHDAMVKKWYMVRDGHPVVEFVASPDSLRGSCEVAVFLTMLETSGNQRYVFSSPRQKENIGGSYLLTMLAPWTAELAEAHGIGTKIGRAHV